MFRVAWVAVLITVITAVGCGGASGSNSLSANKSSFAVTVEPSGIGQVWQGTQVQFAAKIAGQTSQTVTWSVQEGKAGGVVDTNGLYTAPTASGTFHVVATSTANPKASGTASVQVVPAKVSIGPSAETLRVGGQRLFSGFVLAADQRVTWNLQEGAAAGTITANGLYTAPTTTGTFHLIATSVFNPNLSATAPITTVGVGFVPTSAMAVPRSRHSATLLTSGGVLIAGGTADTLHSAEVYTVGSGSFTPTTGAMVHLRSKHCASILQDGKVLISGGADANGNLITTAEVFDPSTQNFVARGDLNQGRTGATCTSLLNGKVLIAGGQDSAGTVLSSAELYDPTTASFSATGRMSSPRSEHTATLLSNGKVLLAGTKSETSSAELYDPTTGLFTATGSMSKARAHHTTTLLPNGKVLVLGGSSAGISDQSAETFDPATGSFQPAGKLLVPRDSHSATLLPNGMVLVAGGYTRGFDEGADPYFESMFASELFDPGAFASTSAASLEARRSEHAATLLGNGQVLVTGGVDGSQEFCCRPRPTIVSLASSELYK